MILVSFYKGTCHRLTWTDLLGGIECQANLAATKYALVPSQQSAMNEGNYLNKSVAWSLLLAIE